MRSIAGALAWELVASRRWQLIGSALAMLLLPMLVLAMISSISPIRNLDAADGANSLYFAFLEVNIVVVSVALLALSSMRVPRLYTAPATTATLVAGQLLPGAAIMFLNVIVWSQAMKLTFRTGIPSFEPAVFATTAYIAAQAAVWLCYRSRWMIFALTVVAGVFGLWIKVHFGPALGDPAFRWVPMMFLEGLLLAVLVGASWRVAVYGFARHRRGEAPFSLGIVARLEKLLERWDRRSSKFATPTAAQTWYFQQRGWIAPAIVLSVCFFSPIVWVFVSREIGDLIEVWAIACWYIAGPAALGGLFLGALGARDQTSMGQFLATRPITTPEMSRRLLIVAAQGFALAWLCWGASFLILLLAAQLFGETPTRHLPPGFGWPLLGLAVVTSWIAMSTIMTLTLVDRGRLIFRILTGVFLASMALAMFANFVGGNSARVQALHALGAIFGVAATLATGALFYYAYRRRLVELPVAVGAIVCWGVLLALVVWLLPGEAEQDRVAPGIRFLNATFSVFVRGSISLTVAPIAATPLALAWNRTR